METTTLYTSKEAAEMLNIKSRIPADTFRETARRLKLEPAEIKLVGGSKKFLWTLEQIEAVKNWRTSKKKSAPVAAPSAVSTDKPNFAGTVADADIEQADAKETVALKDEQAETSLPRTDNPATVDSKALSEPAADSGKKIMPATDAADAKNITLMNNAADIVPQHGAFMQHLQNLPKEILSAKRWIKVGTAADPKAPTTKAWTLAANQEHYNKLRGNVGFVCSVHPDDRAADPTREDYLLIDADHVLNAETGEFVNELAATWCKFLLANLSDSVFCEYSMSRTGLHILARPTPSKFNLAAHDNGTLYFGKHDTKDEKNSCPKIELFVGSQGRQVVLTGDLYQCTADAQIPAGNRVDEILQTLITQIEIQNVQDGKTAADTQKPVDADKPKRQTGLQTLYRLGHGIAQKTIDDICIGIKAEHIIAKGFIFKAPIGHFICPKCKSGTGKHHSGALAVDYNKGFTHWHCFNGDCDVDGNNIQLFAEIWHLNFKADFVEIVRRICDIFDITCEYTEQAKILADDDAADDDNEDFIGTKDLVRDCPVNLRVPDGYEFGNKGIFYIVPPRKKSDEPKRICVANTPIVPTKKFIEHGTSLTTYEIQIKSRRKWWTTTFSGQELQNTQKVIRLADFAASIESPQLLAKFFARILMDKNLPETKIFTKPGWQKDGTFVYPTGGANYICRRKNIDYDDLFATHGSAEKWKEKFQEVIGTGGHTLLKCAVIGACAAAPLLKILHVPNFSLHIEGHFGFAKTPLIKFGLSIYGDPTEGQLLRSWDSSAKNRTAMAAGFCDLPQGLDELESLKKKDEDELAKSVYDFTQGIVNQANQKNGDVRTAEKFRGVRISTGERPLLKDNDKGGAYKRHLNFRINKPLFNDGAARDLHIFCERNHGHFGRPWIEYITEHQEQILADFDQLIQDLYNATDRINAKALEETHIRAVAACIVAFLHFQCCLKLAPKFDSNSALTYTIVNLRDLPTKEEISDFKRWLDLLVSWVSEHPKNFINYNGKTYTVNGALSFSETSGIFFDNGEVGIYPNAFRRIVEEELHLPNYKKFLSDLYDNEKIICPSRREKATQQRISGERKKFYLFAAGVLREIDKDDDTASTTDIKDETSYYY